MTTPSRNQVRLETFKDWLHKKEEADLPHAGRWLFHIGRVIYGVGRNLIQGNTNLHAMSLVYTTLLSIVPLLALSFSVLKGFGVHNQLEPILQDWLLAPLGPQSEEITASVLDFVDNIRVGVLGAVGLGVLVYTVVSLVQKVEKAFNEIWHVHHNRPLTQRFSNYLSVIMMGPLLAFSALGATAALVGSEYFEQVRQIQPFGWLIGFISQLVPFAFIITLFTFLNTLIPNTRVKFRHAMLGGLVSGIAWQSVGYLFAMFVATSTRYTAIYSGFAVGILLLLWIYLAWLILLLGAEVTFNSQNAQRITLMKKQKATPSKEEQLGLTLLYDIALRFNKGLPGLKLYDWPTAQVTDPEDVDRMVRRLTKAGWILCTEQSRLVPAKPLAQIRLADVIQSIRQAHGNKQQVPEAIRDLHLRMEKSLVSDLADETLESWVSGGPPAKEVRPEVATTEAEAPIPESENR